MNIYTHSNYWTTYKERERISVAIGKQSVSQFKDMKLPDLLLPTKTGVV